MQCAFNKGLWSNKLQNRFDVEQYRSACSELTNFTILPQGGIAKRNGTAYLLGAYDSTKKSILIPFQIDKETTYIVEFSGNGFMRILSFDGTTLTVKQAGHSTGYTDAELDELHWVQIGKKLYVTQRNHAPHRLSKITDTTWLWTPASNYPSAGRVNQYYSAYTLTLAASSGISVGFTFSQPWLQQGDVGRFLVARNDQGKAGYAIITSWTNTTNGVCRIIETFSDITLTSSEWCLQGTGGGHLDPSHYGPEGKLTTIDAGDIVGGNTFFRTTDVGRYVEMNGGFVEIVGWVSVSQVRGTIIKCMNDHAPTHNFLLSQPEWGTTDRYPKTVAFYENRLLYGGTNEKSGNVWGSRSQFFDDFTSHSNDEYMLQYLLSGATLHEILWMVGAQVLTVGTTNGIWTIGREDTSAVLTPTTPMLGYQSTISCANIRPATIGNIIFFTQRNRKILRSFIASSNINIDKAVPTDETLFADPFIASNIYQIAAQSNPYVIVWTTNQAGELWGLNYIQEQQVNSWFKITTDGLFESLMVYPQENSDDLLWTTIKRTVNGSTVRYIERFADPGWPDSTKAFTSGGATTTLTGYTHLIAKKVIVCTAEQGWLKGTGGMVHEFTISGAGEIDITGWTATVEAAAGLPFKAEAKTMNWYGGVNDPSYEKLRRLTKINVTVLNSINGEVGIQVEEGTTPEYVGIFDETQSSEWTGRKEVTVQPGAGKIIKLCVRQTQPEHLIVTGLGCNLK